MPLLFLHVTSAIAAAATTSLVAQFAVGAAKSRVVPPLRWWVADTE